MKITQIKVYKVDLHVKGTPRAARGGKVGFSTVDSTIVEILTDTGISGIGEACPFPRLLDSYSNGVRQAIREFAPALIGQNPLEINKIHDVMNKELQGHQYAKSPIDIALWDILGKHCNLPICTLLGGRYGEAVELYMTIPVHTPSSMAENTLKFKEQGYRRFQFKVGGTAEEDIDRIVQCHKMTDSSDTVIVDANGSWLSHEAMKVIDATKDLGIHIEQPCKTYEECLKIRSQTTLPLALDESIHSISDVLRAFKDNADATIGLKLSKMGGISHMKQCRDLCVRLGFPIKVDAAWGSEITQAALAHVAHSTPAKHRLFVAVLSPFNEETVARGLPEIVNGTITTTDRPGLGLTLNYDIIGQPVFTI